MMLIRLCDETCRFRWLSGRDTEVEQAPLQLLKRQLAAMWSGVCALSASWSAIFSSRTHAISKTRHASFVSLLFATVADLHRRSDGFATIGRQVVFHASGVHCGIAGHLLGNPCRWLRA